MRRFLNLRSTLYLVAGLVLGVVLTGTVVAVAATSSSSVKVCVTGKNAVRAATARSTCPRGTHARRVAAAGPRGPVGPAGPGAIDLSGTLPGSDADYTTLATIGSISVSWKCTASDVVVVISAPTFRAQGTRYVDGVANAVQGATMISVQASNPKTVGFDLLLASTPTDSASLRVLAHRGVGGVCTVSGQLIR